MSKIIDSFKNEYGFLSNFYPCKIEYKGKIWNSTEHAYQSQKSEDPIFQESIRNAPFASSAKKLGSKKGMAAKEFELRKDWDNIKLDIMNELVRIKFKDPILKQKLLDTGNAELIEGNFWHDYFFGVCDGIGENHLGKILMRVRDEIKLDKALGIEDGI